MRSPGVRFSIARHAQWAPGLTSREAWAAWSKAPYAIVPGEEPGVKPMPPMLRRRAGFLGKMALEVAYQCLDGLGDIPTVFCSRHGDVARAVELLTDLAKGEALSPTAFGMAVHNAIPGLFTIARADRANHIALASGEATIEHAVIEACGLLADGAPAVLLVACDCPLPALFTPFESCEEQPFAWAWLMTAADDGAIALNWSACDDAPKGGMPGGLQVAAFHQSGARSMERCDGRLRWHWSRDA
ncbi:MULTISPECIES: beta-ketoacyl synthase chain length factor [unclassified Duganella]|uniref:beta-ketoacyl synthase chain length factor n=1 Tax=unclassified Duganella TaxID=2636909 RepID=UPI00088C2015|nr:MULTISPECIES: beta-ketoacyl synthase chain length factor [unclassified Duganella]SDF41322.1 Beta-ketoacyl synthase, N-terminal domain [Duganella sp. OV458]SDI85291.1 Beta-ketoacyl synthase, N-terminal domain [Duganella sp. OV510]